MEVILSIIPILIGGTLSLRIGQPIQNTALPLVGEMKRFFYSSAQYMYQDVIYKNSPQNYNQYQFSTNLDAKITKAIKFGFDILGRQTVDNRGVRTTEDLFSYFLTTSPMSAPYYPNGLLRTGYDGITNNAVLMVSDLPGTSKTTNNTLNLKPKIRIDLDVITPGLYAEDMQLWTIHSTMVKQRILPMIFIRMTLSVGNIPINVMQPVLSVSVHGPATVAVLPSTSVSDIAICSIMRIR